MRVYKAVGQNYEATNEILQLLEAFRNMVNESIQIGIQAGVTSLKALSLEGYQRLRKHNVPSYYKICAISKAAGLLKNHRKNVRRIGTSGSPYCRKAILTTCYGFKIEGTSMKLPVGPRKYAYISLTHHTQRVLSTPGLSVRSATLTARRVSIVYSKEIVETDPKGAIGVDSNLDNITTASSDGTIRVYDVSKATQVRSCYRSVRSRFARNDNRIRRRICAKYGRKQKEKVSQILHHTSKSIVEEAKRRQFSIVLEKLTGIRKLYQRGNHQTRRFRFLLNS